MPRGGRRAGAGRKPGSAATKSREYANALAVDGNLSPLSYMIEVLRDPQATTQRRDTFAIAAAPFVHPKLGAIATLDAAGKLGSIMAINMISVPNEMFLSREMADKDYRFRNGIEGSIVTPIWTAPGADRDRDVTIEASSDGPGAPREPDGAPTEAPTVEGEAEVVPLRAVGDK